jgi:exodeoxyribonuclease VII large subunit
VEFKAEEKIYSVSEITRHIKYLLEADDSLHEIWVRGEISNFVRHSSGHVYFTIKDENSQLPCVMFRTESQTLVFTPENGLKVVVYGEISVYESGGRYQFYVLQMQPEGLGALYLAYEQLKNRLQKEGLFDPAHKKPIPFLPQRIGIITSPTGAAIRDMLNVIQRRFPNVYILVYPVRVQGSEAPGEIVQAIKEMNEYQNFDVLIVGRGGGSIEDLWAFNDEGVARAIYDSQIPVISAVGHEVDYTIADFVADLRAPTPSAAAELVVKNKCDLAEQIQSLRTRLVNTGQSQLEKIRQQVVNFQDNIVFKRPADQIQQLRQRLDEIMSRMAMTLQHRLELLRGNFLSLTGKMNTLSPLATLSRGYSICFKLPEKVVVKEATQLRVKDKVEIKLSRGEVLCEVSEVGEGTES